MNANRFRLAWALAIAASMIGGCGGGASSDGIDGTGTQLPTQLPLLSYGRVTSFGGIGVNGVQYDTTGATFIIDGAASGQTDLALGNVAAVVGQIEPGATRAVAQQVISDHVLMGTVASVSSDGLSLVTLGQTVRVDDGTIYSAELSGGLSALSANDAISVSGFRTATGDIVATRVERQKAGAVAFKTTGAVTAFDVSNKRLQINGLVVDYSGAQLLPADAENTIERGVFVEVKAGEVAAGQVVAATSVQIMRMRVPGGVDASAKIEGYVTDIGQTDGTVIHVDGLPVLTKRDRILATNALVKVDGATDSVGEVVANEATGVYSVIQTGESLQFTANFAGNVTWGVSLGGTTCTPAVCGTIDSTGKFTAPMSVSAVPGLLITATSAGGRSATVVVFVVATPIGIGVSPTSATVPISGVLDFTAFSDTESPLGKLPAVQWSVSGEGCRDASCGTISSTGEYTAPAVAPNPPA